MVLGEEEAAVVMVLLQQLLRVVLREVPEQLLVLPPEAVLALEVLPVLLEKYTAITIFLCCT